jgi:RNA polymerase sigma factor (TIGR02999 family)
VQTGPVFPFLIPWFVFEIGLMGEVTRILDRIPQGDTAAAEELLPLVYEELRRLAAHKLAHEAPGQTLQPTALVHEAWLRLGHQAQRWTSSGHFLGAAAEAMRRILIDKARRKNRVRHGKGLARVDLDELDLAVSTDDELLLHVDDALKKLAAEDKSKAELVKLRFYAGLSIPEAAEALGWSETTAKRRWAYARAWLYDELTGPG